MKIIDPEVNLLANFEDFNDQVINVVVKSTSIEALPFIHRIGDIIRVHRGVYVKTIKSFLSINEFYEFIFKNFLFKTLIKFLVEKRINLFIRDKFLKIKKS